MIWLAYSATQETRLTAEALVALMQPSVLAPATDIEPLLKQRSASDPPLFIGSLDTQSFKLRHAVKDLGAFVPIITGTLKENGTGRTELVMNYDLDPGVYWMLILKGMVILAVATYVWFQLPNMLHEMFINYLKQAAVVLGIFFTLWFGSGVFRFHREIGVWEEFLAAGLRQAPDD